VLRGISLPRIMRGLPTIIEDDELVLFGINKPTIYKSDVKINLDVLMVDKLTP